MLHLELESVTKYISAATVGKFAMSHVMVLIYVHVHDITIKKVNFIVLLLWPQ